MSEITFQSWPKIARLDNEQMIVSEKLDGTNACIQFQPPTDGPGPRGAEKMYEPGTAYVFAAQSRSRLITPDKDNAGFATWVHANHASLFADLGYGIHFGEFWGSGIQRRYGMDRKVFSLFNTHRWEAKRGHFATENLDVVPLLWTGPVDIAQIQEEYNQLRWNGSRATTFDNPEGIVVYLTATGVSWKLTDAPSGPSKPRVEGE